MSNKYTKDQLETAKQMYMDNIPVVDIAKEMDIKRPTLQYYIKKGWQRERDLNNSRMLKDISKGHIADLDVMGGSAMKVINRALQALNTRSKEPTTQEAMHVVKILEVMHKIVTQDEANSKNTRDINPEEAIQEIQNDPFLGTGDISD